MRTLVAISVALTAAVLAAAPVARERAPATSGQALDPNAQETTEHRDRRMHWWREARFGMFIHWGLYALPAGEWKGQRQRGIGEWIMHDLKIPVADYAGIASQFNPVQFDANAWVSAAKAAGMKYIVMTSKHHDGFAMFHSSTDPFNIYDATPFKRDPIAEMGAAAARLGLKFGVYYSQAQDWHHPGGAAYGGHWDPAQDGDLHEYVRTVAAPQVSDLLARYRPAILWWDTPVDMSPEDIKALTAGFAENPNLISNNRLGNGVPGDTETPEQTIPATGFPGKDWETCMTINDTWGYKSFDTNFKSSSRLLRNLIDIASKGGNYLLNVGPDAMGVIPKPELDRLAEMGAWLAHNGDSIYGTTASPYRRLPFDGRATVKDRTLYLNVFTWPDGGLRLPGLQTAVRDAIALGTGQVLTVEKTADGTIAISEPTTVDPISTSIALHLAAPPVVVEPELVIAPDPGGAFHLTAGDATLNGSTIQVEGTRPLNIGYWTRIADTVEWKLRSPAATFSVSLEYACQPGSEGSTFEILVDGRPTGIEGLVARTNSWQDYRTVSLDGTLTLTAGTHVIRVVPKTKPGNAVMNLRQISLTRK